MGPLALMAILAAAGVAKSELVDRKREKKQRKLAAETQKYSPWTGLQAGPINDADPFGSAIQGATAGAMFGQASEANALAKDELGAKKELWKSMSGPNNAGQVTQATNAATMTGAGPMPQAVTGKPPVIAMGGNNMGYAGGMGNDPNMMRRQMNPWAQMYF